MIEDEPRSQNIWPAIAPFGRDRGLSHSWKNPFLAWPVNVDSSTNYSEQQNAAYLPRLWCAQSRKVPLEQNSIWAGDKGQGRMLTEQGVVADGSRLHFCPLRLESRPEAMFQYGQASAPAAKRYVR